MKHVEQSGVFQKLWQAPALRWFALAAGLLLLFLAYTAILTTGALDASTLKIEQWLLERPITRVDCVFVEWRNLGNPSTIFLLTILVAGACLLLRYRWPVLPYLLALLVVCIACELVGKTTFVQTVPRAVSFGMSALDCNQIQGQSHTVHLEALAGLWWKLPAPPPNLIARVHQFGQQPYLFPGDAFIWSYPGGHAIRCSFLGAVVAWLCWRHIKPLPIRVPVTTVALVVFFSIGCIQFYLGAHLITDTIAGYLFGLAAGCCAVGLLHLYSPRPRAKPASKRL